MPRTVLVTGGAGYIGSHACKALKAAGYLPVTYDSLITGWQDAVKFGPFEQGDLADLARLDAVFARWKPDAVMHFAALSLVGLSPLRLSKRTSPSSSSWVIVPTNSRRRSSSRLSISALVKLGKRCAIVRSS